MYNIISNSVIRSILNLGLIFLLICNLNAKESEFYFYKPSNVFGSDTYFNPVNVVLNGSYDILRNGSLYNGNKDITRNNMFPDGFDAEIFTSEVLKEAWLNDKSKF